MSKDILNDTLSSKMNQTIKLSGIKSFAKSTNQQHYYQPNFILVDANSNQSKAIFGDIVPLYHSYDEVVSIIVTSWDSLYDFILRSSVIMVCILSIASQVINNAAYHSYLLVMSGYNEILELPNRYRSIKTKYTELLSILLSSDTRSLFFLEIKLETQTILNKLLSILSDVSLITQKLYLSIIIISCLSVLSLSSVASSTTPNFLSRFLSNNTIKTSTKSDTYFELSKSEVVSAIAIENAPVTKILQHKVVEGESVDLIAESYAITTDSIRFNNPSITDPKAGDTLFIPWSEGYIYNITSDMSTAQIAQIFGISEELIIQQNQAILNTQNNTFANGSLVLIPTSDFASITSSLEKQKALEASIKENKEREERRQKAISEASVSANTYKGVFSDSPAPKPGMFNWPAQGSISRCVQPGHIACDLANRSAPPIFAMQSGTVISSGWDSSGYGNMIIIDHGTIEGKNYKTLYAHLSEIYVKTGDFVQINQSIGKMGTTGNSSGIHLHFEVIVNGVKQNPMNYLA